MSRPESLAVGGILAIILAFAFWTTTDRYPDAVTTHSGADEGDARMTGACELRGTVWDLQARRIESASVCATPIGAGAGRATVCTRTANGDYTLGGLRAGVNYRVTALAAGAGAAETSKHVRLTECAEPAGVDIVLWIPDTEHARRADDRRRRSTPRAGNPPVPKASVVIRVEDEMGRAVAQAHVGLRGDANEFLPAAPAGDGFYLVEAVAPGRYRAVSADAATVDDENRPSVSVGAGDERIPVTLTLRGGSRIHVTVQRGDGSLSGGLQVYAIPRDSDPRLHDPVTMASEGGDGRYEIAPLRSGAYRVYIGDEHNPPTVLDVALAGGETRHLAITRGHTGRISGRLVDSAGTALPHALVRAMHATVLPTRPKETPDGPGPGRAVTDENGRFEIDGVVDGAVYRVMASVDAAVVADRDDVASGAYVEMVMESPPRSLARQPGD